MGIQNAVFDTDFETDEKSLPKESYSPETFAPSIKRFKKMISFLFGYRSNQLPRLIE
jgi:hypothetical protein